MRPSRIARSRTPLMPDAGQITRPPRRRRSYLGFSAIESLIVQREIPLNVERNRKMQNDLSHGSGVLSFQTELRANDFKYSRNSFPRWPVSRPLQPGGAEQDI